MSGDDTKITCGTVGKPCKSLDDYPICHPKDEEAGWVGLEEIIVCEYENDVKDFRLLQPGQSAPEECVTARPPQWKDVAETKYQKEDEIPQLLKGDFLNQVGLKGVCRSPYMGEGKPSSWYGYVDHAGHAAFLTLYNMGTPSIIHDQNGIELSYEEMMGLANCEELNLQQVDVVCTKAPELKRDEDKDGNIDRSYTPGRYHFKKDKLSLGRILDVLRNDDVEIEGLSGKRRKVLIENLDKVYKEATKGEDTIYWIIGSSAVMQTVFILAILFQDKIRTFFSKIFPSISGKSDLRKEMNKKLAKNPDYYVKGLTDMAIEAWKRVDNPKFRHLVVHGKSGSGKDMLKDEMIRLLVKGDPRIPENIRRDFKDAPITGVSAAASQEGTMFRGTVADKTMAIFRKAQRGPHILDIREFDRFVLSGKSSSGQSEQVSELMLSEMEKPAIRKNLIILASTARYEEMSIEADNLMRRMPDIYKPVDSLSVAIENLNGPGAQELADYYGVKFPKETIEAAGRLAEVEYRPSTVRKDYKTGMDTIPLARYAAIERVLMAAAKIAAEKSTDKIVKVEHVVEATEQLAMKSLPEDYVAEILAKPADDCMVYDLEDKAAEGQMESARTFMEGNKPSAESDHPFVKEMDKYPEYKGLQPFEKAERAQAMELLMAELKTYDMLYRFFDENTGRFLEGKFDILAKAVQKGGAATTKASLIKAAEDVEKSNPKARKDAEKAAENFARSKGKK